MYLEYQNDLTGALDNHLHEQLKKFDGNKTYKHRTYILVDNSGITEKYFAIRCPGVTIGSVKYTGNYPDNMIIADIYIDDTLNTNNKYYWEHFYNRSLLDFNLKEWIGKPLILKEEYLNEQN